jgi:hypothetical protein
VGVATPKTPKNFGCSYPHLRGKKFLKNILVPRLRIAILHLVVPALISG